METVTTSPSIQKIAAKVEKVLNPDIFWNKNIVVIVPTQNDEAVIGSLILKILQFHVTAIVIDDGSTDDTCSIAELAGANVIRLEGYQGKSSVLKIGIQKAIALNPDVVVIMDEDGLHLAAVLPTIIQPILNDQADIVVGSRYIHQIRGKPAYRIVGHLLFQWLLRTTTGIAISDHQSGFRAFSPHAFSFVNNVRLDFPLGPEMSFVAHDRHLRIVEVPITFDSTYLLKKAISRDPVDHIKHVLSLTARYRPLLFYSILGLMTLVISVFSGISVFEEFSRNHLIPLRNTLISAMSFILGWTSFIIGVVLTAIRGLLIELRE